MSYRPIVIVALLLAVAGCRQPDAEIPQPTGEQANKTGDLARDLLNLAAGQADAREDLRQDLENLTAEPPPPHLAEALALRLDEALEGATLDEPAAAALAQHLFVATGVHDLSERQIEALKLDITQAVTQAGGAPEQAAAVGDVVGEIQAAVGTNHRRWWHVR